MLISPRYIHFLSLLLFVNGADLQCNQRNDRLRFAANNYATYHDTGESIVINFVSFYKAIFTSLSKCQKGTMVPLKVVFIERNIFRS